MKDLGGAFLIKVVALILLAGFFSQYKKWYPKQTVRRETLYAPQGGSLKNNNNKTTEL